VAKLEGERADLVGRLEWWLGGNLRERAVGRVPNLLNPATVLGWLGAGHSEEELQERLAKARAALSAPGQPEGGE
jgi:hypothetical protein